MRTETVRIDALMLDSANVRRHSKRNLDAIAASLKQFGQQKPVVVDACGNVLAGNATLEAARSLGWDKIAVARSGLKGAERVAYAIADNRTAELAEWDEAELAGMLAGLQTDDSIDQFVTGFDPAEIDRLIADALHPDGVVEDEVPGVLEEPVAQSGDLWLLDEHRVLCGDATKVEDVGRLLAGARARMCFTDPPWNVAVGQDSNPRHRQRKGLANDDMSGVEFGHFLDSFAEHLGVVSGDVYCVLGASEWPALDRVLRASGLHWSATIVWVKQAFVLGRSKYHRRYEPIWYGWRDTSSFCGDRSQDDVWEIDRPFRSEAHPTMKPVALVGRAVVNSSRNGDVIYDPFLGSGTTLIAAEHLGRECYGIEIEPRYVDVTLKRWMNLTSNTNSS